MNRRRNPDGTAPDWEVCCANCGHEFDRVERIWVRINEWKGRNECPECGSDELLYDYGDEDDDI